MSINKFVRGVKIAGYIIVSLASIGVIAIATFIATYIAFHSHYETKYRTIKVVKQEDLLKVKNNIPLYDLFIELHERPYAINQFDCSQRAYIYYKALREKGANAKIIIVAQGQTLHSFVWIEFIGYFDPTQNTYYEVKGTRNPVLDWQHDFFLTMQWGLLLDALGNEEIEGNKKEFNEGNLQK